MKLIPQSAPYIRKNVSVKRMMMDVIIALMPVTLFACIQNGWKGVYVFLISIGTMLATEIIAHALIKWPTGMKVKELFTKEGFNKVKGNFTINNITAPLISALIYALIMPAGCDWYVVFIGALFGMLVGKMIFGGLGSNIFNPAAVGRVFVGVCFGSKLVYGQGGVDVAAGGTPLAYLNGNLGYLEVALSNYSLKELFLGQIPGCMGEVSAVFILVGAIYLFVRRSADIRSFLSMMLSFTVITLVVAGVVSAVDEQNFVKFVLFQLLSGGLLFGAVFMITDPVTSPTTGFGRICAGAAAGALTALIRYIGAYPEGVAFSILIVNMFVPTIDHLMVGKPRGVNWKQALGLGLATVVLCLIAGFDVAYDLGWNQEYNYIDELYAGYDKSKTVSITEGFESEYILERQEIYNKESKILGYVYTVKHQDAYGSLKLLVGIDTRETVVGIYTLINNQSYSTQIQSHIDTDYNGVISYAGLSGADVDNIDVNCGATNSAKKVKAMVKAALDDSYARAKVAAIDSLYEGYTSLESKVLEYSGDEIPSTRILEIITVMNGSNVAGTLYRVLEESEWGNVEILVGINEDDKLDGVRFLVNDQSYGVLAGEKLPEYIKPGLTSSEVDSIVNVGSGATNTLNTVKKLVQLAFVSHLGGNA